MHTYIHAYIHISPYMCIYIHTLYVHIHTCVHTRLHKVCHMLLIPTYTCTYAHTCIHAEVNWCTHACNTDTHAYVHNVCIYIYTYILCISTRTPYAILIVYTIHTILCILYTLHIVLVLPTTPRTSQKLCPLDLRENTNLTDSRVEPREVSEYLSHPQ